MVSSEASESSPTFTPSSMTSLLCAPLLLIIILMQHLHRQKIATAENMTVMKMTMMMMRSGETKNDMYIMKTFSQNVWSKGNNPN